LAVGNQFLFLNKTSPTQHNIPLIYPTKAKKKTHDRQQNQYAKQQKNNKKIFNNKKPRPNNPKIF
ncbi:hypothetical protein ACNIRP_25080, partial [Escherichia coli]